MRRVAVVTGGSRGIGFAVARLLVQQGHEVVITGRTTASLEAAVGALRELGTIRALVLDSADPEQSRRVLGETGAQILVCNVGMGFSGSVTTTSLAEWTRVLDTNLTSAFTAIGAVMPSMLETDWGRIVSVGSIASHQAIRYGVAYTASKHALLGLTRAVAEDTRSTGIRVNMVAPAFVRTDMTLENTKRIAQASGASLADAERRLGEISDLGRLIEPEEVAEKVVELTAEGLETTGISVPLGFQI